MRTSPLPPVASATLACMVGAAAAVFAWAVQHSPMRLLIDFSQNYAAAQFLRHGQDPYQLIGPGRAFEWQWPLFYPLTTAVAALPFTILSSGIAPIAFATLGAATFTYALGRLQPFKWWRYLVLLSAPFATAVASGQASCLLASMFVLAPVASLAAIKPNMGAAIVAARLDRRTITFALAGGAVLLAISLALRPGWIPEWLAAVRADPFHIPAIARPGGFLLALSLLRWRRPEARLLFALAIIPQTLFIYDALPLLFIPRRASEAILLVVLSHLAFLMALTLPAATTDQRILLAGNWIVGLLFLPALAMVLVSRNDTVVTEVRAAAGVPM